MSTLPAATSPLMQPVEYEGQPYYTSQYFYQQYRANSEQTGKYQRHRDFLRLIRSIENYPLHIEQGYIVELEWDRIKSGPAQDLRRWKPLFQATGYYPLLLISATFQLELAHHLDDAISKKMAVTANVSAARQNPHPTILAQYPEMQAIVDQAHAVIALATKTAEARSIAESAQREAAKANANAARALDSQLFFTVAEYACFNHLHRQIPESAYKACSDHLRLYCMDNAIPFRRIPVGGKQWEDEYGFHVSVYTEALPGWLKRRYAQTDLQLVHTGGD